MSAKLDRLRHAAAAPLHPDVSINEHRAAILQLGASRAGKTTDDDDAPTDGEQKCKRCGTSNDTKAKFCDACGRSLGDAEKFDNSDARDRAQRSARTQAAQSQILAKIEAQTKLLETQISEQAQDGLGLFTPKELVALGLVPTSSATMQHEGKTELGLPSPSEAQAMLRGNR